MSHFLIQNRAQVPSQQPETDCNATARNPEDNRQELVKCAFRTFLPFLPNLLSQHLILDRCPPQRDEYHGGVPCRPASHEDLHWERVHEPALHRAASAT